MKSIKKSLLLLLLSTFFLANNLNAQTDVIRLKWAVKGYNSLQVRSLSGGSIKVEWGDGSFDIYSSSTYVTVSHSYQPLNITYDVVITSTNCKLRGITIFNGELLDIDLSANPNLEFLTIHKEVRGKLTSLDLSQNTILKTLHLESNNLTTLDLSNNTELVSLECQNNKLASIKLPPSINLSANYEKNYLSFDELYYISQAQGSSIANSTISDQHIDGLPVEIKQGEEVDFSLYYFSQGTNTIAVKLDGVEALLGVDYTESGGKVTFLNRGAYTVSISNSLITSRDGAQLIANIMVAPEMQKIQFAWAADIANPTKTIYLAGKDGLDAYIDWGDGSVSHYTAEQWALIPITKTYANPGSYLATIVSVKDLSMLEVGNQKVTEADLSGCTSLDYLYLASNDLRTLDLRNSKKLRHIEVSDNKNLEELYIEGCSEIENISLYHLDKLHTLTINDCSKLVHLNLYELNLHSLDFSGCVSLNNVNMTTTRVSQITNLTSPVLSYIVFSREPNLTELDVSACSAIESIALYESAFTTLNAAGCSSLIYIDISYTQMQNLLLDGCTSLAQLYITSSQVQSLDLSGLTSLVDVYVDENELVELNLPVSLSNLGISSNFLYDFNYLYGLKAIATTINYGDQAYPDAYVISAGGVIDYTSQRYVNGIETTFEVHKDNSLAVGGIDYSISNGTITFHVPGVFRVKMMNTEVAEATISSRVLVDYSPEHLTFSWKIEQDLLDREFYLGCTSGKLLIDWGDGTSKSIVSASDLYRNYKKRYSNAGEYTVTITASEGAMIKDYSVYQGQLQSITLTNTKALESFSIPYNNVNTLDLSDCSQLNSINISYNSISSLTLGSSSGSLQSFDANNNYLNSLSYLWSLSQSMSNANSINLGLQKYKDDIFIAPGESVDYTSQATIDGTTSNFSVANFSETAVDGVDYSMANGVITFYRQGAYKVSITNGKLPSVTVESYVIVGLAGGPQKISFIWNVNKDNLFKDVYVRATEGTIMVDWGDGSSNKYTFQNEHTGGLYKEYSTPGTYVVTIQGDSRLFIKGFEAYSKNILEFDASQCWSIKDLSLNSNMLTSIDLSNNVGLSLFSATENKLESIDLSNNTELRNLDLGANKLTALDLSNQSQLTFLQAYSNGLSSLRLSTLVNSAYINAQKNKLSLDNMYEISQIVQNSNDLRLEWQVVQDEVVIAVGESRPYAPVAPTLDGTATQLMVYKNGLLAEPGVDYNATASDIIYLKEGIYTVELRNTAISAGDDAYGISTTIVGGGTTPNSVNFDWFSPYSNTPRLLYFATSKGASVSIDWGNSNQQIILADGISTYVSHFYEKGSYAASLHTNSALNMLDLIYSDLESISFNSPAIQELYLAGNHLKTLDISSLSLLREIDVSENNLFFDDMLAISQAIVNADNKYIGTQYTHSRNEETFISRDQVIDYSKYFSYEYQGIPTICFVKNRMGEAAVDGTDYTIADGKIKFLITGFFTVEFTNAAIVSNSSYPAKIVDVVYVEASDDTSLNQLQVNGVNIPLSPNVYDYTINLPNNSTSATVVAATSSSKAQVISDLIPMSLVEGINVYRIEVKSERGTIKTYTVQIVRQSLTPSDDATLSNFGLDKIDIQYNPSQLVYNVEVEYEDVFVLITSWANHSHAVVMGGDLAEGSNLRSLAVGSNTFAANVIAEDGVTTKTYVLNITRKEQNVTLKNLAFNGEPIALVVGQYNYTKSVCADVISALIEAIPTKANAVVGGAGYQVLNTGSNEFTITVTSAGGRVSQNYTLTISRSNEIDGGTISGDQSICQGNTTVEFTSSSGAAGGSGSFSYQWEKSIDLLSWDSILGETSSSYTEPSILEVNTYYRRKVNDGSCEAYSNTVSVIVTVKSAPIILGQIDLCDYTVPISYSTEEGMQNYSWSATGGNIIAGQGTSSIQVQWFANPTNTISVSYKDGGCETNVSSNVTFGSTEAVIAGFTAVCSVGQSNHYTTEANMQNYSWSVTGGTIVAGQGTSRVEVSWTTAGDNIIAVSYDKGACYVEANHVVKVGEFAPTITGPNNICDITSTSIYTTDPNMPSYIWQVTGGTIVAGQGTNSIEVEWTSAGANKVMVSYFARSACSISAEYYVTIAVGRDIAGPVAICSIPQSETYVAVPGMVSYSWNVVGGVITSDPTLNSVEVMWTSVGSNSISVSYTNGTCSISASKQVAVNNVSASITGPSNVCGSTINDAYGTEEGMQSYSWSVAGGAIVSGQGTNSIEVKWTSAGLNTVSVSYTKEACTTSATYNVTVNSVEPVIVGPSSACGDNTQVTYTTDVGMSDYKWIAVGGIIISGQGTSQVVVEWTKAKTHIIGVSYTNGGCTSSELMQVYLKYPIPLIVGPSMACTNTIASVYETEKGMSSYSWSVTGGRIVTGQGSNAITVLWSTTGSYKVTLSVVDASGCTSPVPVDHAVTVGEGTAVTSVSTDIALCEGEPLTLTVTATGTLPSYQWYLNDVALSGATTSSYALPAVSAADAGLYYVKVSGCDIVTSEAIKVSVGLKNILIKKWNDVVLIDNSSNTYVGYQWIKDGVIIPGSTMQFYQEKGGLNGTYKAMLMRKDGGIDYTCDENIVRQSNATQLKAYPVPVTKGDALNLLLENSQSVIVAYELFNLNGQRILRQEISSGQTSVSTSGLAAGVYILKVDTSTGEAYSEKIIVK